RTYSGGPPLPRFGLHASDQISPQGALVDPHHPRDAHRPLDRPRVFAAVALEPPAVDGREPHDGATVRSKARGAVAPNLDATAFRKRSNPGRRLDGDQPPAPIAHAHPP